MAHKPNESKIILYVRKRRLWAFARDFFLIEQCTTVYCVTVTGYYLYRLLCGACTVSVTVRACALQIFHRRTQALTVAETRCTSLCVRRGAPFSPLPQRTDEAIAARCLINTPKKKIHKLLSNYRKTFQKEERKIYICRQ